MMSEFLPAAPRILVVSSQSCDSGSNLRGRYLTKALVRAGARARWINGVVALPYRLDYLVSMLLYLRMIFMPCDIIIGLKPFPNVTIPMLIKKWLGCFTIIDIDDLDFGFRTGIAGCLNKYLQTPLPRFFDMVTYHIDLLRPMIVNTFKIRENRLYQLPQGVDLDIYQRLDKPAWKESWLDKHSLHGKKIVVYSAHLNIASDLDAIYEIIRQAQTIVPELRFLIIGGGPLEKHFRSLAHQMQLDHLCVFTGYLPPEDVAQHLTLGDAAIVFYKDIKVNYYRESMKLREMLALGLRVVCNDVGDLRKFQTYTYQTATDYAACAQKLAEILTNGGDGREKRGMEFVRNNMDWNVIGDKLLEHINVVWRQKRSNSRSTN